MFATITWALWGKTVVADALAGGDERHAGRRIEAAIFFGGDRVLHKFIDVKRTGGYMSNRQAVERLDRNVVGDMYVQPAIVHQLDDVARALRAVTDRNLRTMRIKEAKTRIVKPVADNDVEPALPQILQHPIVAAEAPSAAKGERLRGRLIAPAILLAALAGVGFLMSASFADISRLPGLSWLEDKPRPRLTTPSSSTAPLLAAALEASSSQAETLSTASPPESPIQGPPISLDELSILEACEKMIAAGDMQGARQALAQAAGSGSVNARFALAETFDPNVLAAWGLRDRVADVSAARSLYQQAMTAGDPRAAGRISALGNQ